jgi:MinD-like ATPase involved in chromosome partitioning or flagellar assembly
MTSESTLRSGMTTGGDPLAVPEDALPPPEASRRELDAAQRTVLLLAGEFPSHRMALLRSEPLVAAVRELVEGGYLPDETRQLLVSSGPLDGADPAAALVARCRALAQTPVDRSGADRDSATTLGAPLSSSVTASHESGPDRTRVETPGYRPTRVRKARRRTASRGWRRAVRTMTGGLVKLAPGKDEQLENGLIQRVRTPIHGYRHVVVLSLKGGSGKTTTTAMLGHTFATHRGDRIAAIDASPDAGTLAYRIADEPVTSIRTVLDSADSLRRYVDVRSLSGHASSRLDIVASDADPTVSRPLSGADYRRAAEIMTRFYSVVITDCGAGLMHDAMGPVLDLADQIVVIMSPSVDGARSADLTLDWLSSHGFSDLVRGSVAVINRVTSKPVVQLSELHEHFGSRCRAVLEIPNDSHLAEGADTDLDQAAARTRRAYLTLAAAVADGFDDPSAARGRAR